MVPTAAWKGVISEKGASDGMNQRQQGTWPLCLFLHPLKPPTLSWPQALRSSWYLMAPGRRIKIQDACGDQTVFLRATFLSLWSLQRDQNSAGGLPPSCLFRPSSLQQEPHSFQSAAPLMGASDSHTGLAVGHLFHS